MTTQLLVVKCLFIVIDMHCCFRQRVASLHRGTTVYMPTQKGTLRICKNGHRYYKSSECPICLVCEQQNNTGYFSMLSAPARRALENNGVTNIEQLALLSEQEILKWHGIGKASLPKLTTVLNAHGLCFKK